MDHATNITTFGIVSGDPNFITASLNYSIIDYSIVDVPESPIIDDNGNVYDRHADMGFGSAVGGIVSGRTRYLEVKFEYNGHIYQQAKAINPNIDIEIENINIKIIDNKPVVVLTSINKIKK